MTFYDKIRLLRDKYAHDIDYEVKLSILSQILSATFSNHDLLPKITTVSFDTRIILKMNRKWLDDDGFTSYPESVLSQVLNDLGLEYNFNCCYQNCSAFTYTFEINFIEKSITVI